MGSLLLAILAPNCAIAHALGQSYIFLNIDDGSVSGRIEITTADLNKVLPLDLRTEAGVARRDIDPHIASIQDYLSRKVSMAPDGQNVELVWGNFEILSIPLGEYVQVHFSLSGLEETPTYIDVDYRVLNEADQQHRGFLVIESNWKSGTFQNEAVFSLIFHSDASSQRLDLSSSSLLHGFWEMVKLGVHHIWVGIDHVLFLCALLLPSVVSRTREGWVAVERFRTALIYVLKIVTLFTIAHTITLSLATLGAISLSSRLVESVIAISIAFAALDILYPIFHDRIWLIVFTFGLFHGFGFASVLSSIGIPSNYMAYSLLAFNLGVELGQIAVVSIVFPVLLLVCRSSMYRGFLMPVGAIFLIVISLYWFVERGFMIDLPAGEYANAALGLVGLKL